MKKQLANAQRKLRGFQIAACLVWAAILLTGCMYPASERADRAGSVRDAVRNVSGAVQDYQASTDLLPMQNSDESVPKYEKFRVDFGKLQRLGYISDLPAAAFEKGGRYYFLIQDELEEPVIKLMDVVVYQLMNDVQSWVDNYVITNNGKLPAVSDAYPGFYRIDYQALNKKEPTITSMFSGQTLSTMMDEDGEVFVDYGIDVARALERARSESDGATLPEDLRELLTQQSDFVPVKSAPYQLVGDDPQAVRLEQ